MYKTYNMSNTYCAFRIITANRKTHLRGWARRTIKYLTTEEWTKRNAQIEQKEEQTVKWNSAGKDKRHQSPHKSPYCVNHHKTQTSINNPPTSLHNRQLDKGDKMESKCAMTYCWVFFSDKVDNFKLMTEYFCFLKSIWAALRGMKESQVCDHLKKNVVSYLRQMIIT